MYTLIWGDGDDKEIWRGKMVPREWCRSVHDRWDGIFSFIPNASGCGECGGCLSDLADRAGLQQWWIDDEASGQNVISARGTFSEDGLTELRRADRRLVFSTWMFWPATRQFYRPFVNEPPIGHRSRQYALESFLLTLTPRKQVWVRQNWIKFEANNCWIKPQAEVIAAEALGNMPAAIRRFVQSTYYSCWDNNYYRDAHSARLTDMAAPLQFSAVSAPRPENWPTWADAWESYAEADANRALQLTEEQIQYDEELRRREEQANRWLPPGGQPLRYVTNEMMVAEQRRREAEQADQLRAHYGVGPDPEQVSIRDRMRELQCIANQQRAERDRPLWTSPTGRLLPHQTDAVEMAQQILQLDNRLGRADRALTRMAAEAEQLGRDIEAGVSPITVVREPASGNMTVRTSGDMIELTNVRGTLTPDGGAPIPLFERESRYQAEAEQLRRDPNANWYPE